MLSQSRVIDIEHVNVQLCVCMCHLRLYNLVTNHCRIAADHPKKPHRPQAIVFPTVPKSSAVQVVPSHVTRPPSAICPNRLRKLGSV